MAKLFKIQTYLLDYNDEFKKISQLQNYLNCVIRYGLIEHTHITEADIGEWDDDHPLNIVDCPEAEYEKYFKEKQIMKLTDLQLYTENDKYYLSAKLLHEDKRGYYEMSIPKIYLNISQDCEVNITSDCDYFGKTHTVVDVDFGFGKLYAKPFDDQGNHVVYTCLEEKVHEMTLDEIEKTLGYKIKLKEN